MTNTGNGATFFRRTQVREGEKFSLHHEMGVLQSGSAKWR